MDKITFDEKRIAEGYVNRPWLHKKVIERFVSDCEVTSNFRNGLDVGCGAGLSTKALHLICDRVTGTDISEQMIQVCKEEYKDNKAYTFYRAKVIIPGISEPPARTLRATVPENERHIFR
ncbi:methyltransferase domain-containing protein [Gallintestinimicrobium propionicum]|uniref:methyltransferase domain-containing protein n=1 Tax=Gallintestinimicrobium propionicum TaxID=2981770 RepID=UPI0032C1C270